MRVSIVTISMNQAAYLEECILSVLGQSYDDIEYIVVDPGSSDGSRDIIARYRTEMAHILLGPDRGPADGLNKGFQYATGELYGYLNADDVLLPGAIEAAVEYFKRHSDVDVALGHGYRIDSKGKRIARMFSTRGWSARGYALGVCNAVQQSTFFRAAMYKAIRGFNENNRTCWDSELLVDLELYGAKFGIVDANLSSFRVYTESITGSGRLAEACRQDEQRIAERVLGRPLNSFHQCEAMGRRLLKYGSRPDHVILKIWDRLLALKG